METRSIIDLYHGDEGIDLPTLANNGVQGVILKASQGLAMEDSMFRPRLLQARSLGLLTGSYHFATGDDPETQAQRWMNIANPRPSEVIAFDWETNPNGPTMTYAQACAFVTQVFKTAGRYPLIYGSNLFKENIPPGDSILFKCPLWLASYTSKPALPQGWSKYTLWQFSGDGQGPNQPHTFHGAAGPLDVSQFDGTVAELRAAWPF